MIREEILNIIVNDYCNSKGVNSLFELDIVNSTSDLMEVSSIDVGDVLQFEINN